MKHPISPPKQGHKVNYPMIGDPELKVAKLYDMLPADAGTTSEGRTAATNATVRTVFVIGPDKKIKLMLAYPMSTGRRSLTFGSSRSRSSGSCPLPEAPLPDGRGSDSSVMDERVSEPRA